MIVKATKNMSVTEINPKSKTGYGKFVKIGD